MESKKERTKRVIGLIAALMDEVKVAGCDVTAGSYLGRACAVFIQEAVYGRYLDESATDIIDTDSMRLALPEITPDILKAAERHARVYRNRLSKIERVKGCTLKVVQ